MTIKYEEKLNQMIINNTQKKNNNRCENEDKNMTKGMVAQQS